MTDEKTQEQQEVKEPTLLDKAEQMAQRLEAANKRTEELLTRQEQILSRALISGKSLAGTPDKPVESAKEYKDRILKGRA